jgi:hypothetical protein
MPHVTPPGAAGKAARAPAPLKLADVQAQLDRLARARQQIRPGRDVPDFCQRVADLWSAEARAWAELPSVADFPLGTPSGALLMQAADYARQFADARAMSWMGTGGREPVSRP